VMNKKVANAWKMKLLQSLSRLEDKDTLNQALGELHQIILLMQPSQISSFTYQISKQSPNASLAARKAMLQLLQFLVTQHPLHCNIEKVVELIVNHARYPELAIKEQCQQTMSSTVRHTFQHSHCSLAKGGEGNMMVLLDSLFAVFSEQTATTKEAAGSCLAMAVRPSDAIVPVTITATARNIEDVRHTFRQLDKHGCKLTLPKETIVLPNGTVLLFVQSTEKTKALHATLTSFLKFFPAGWTVEPFSKVEGERVVYGNALNFNRTKPALFARRRIFPSRVPPQALRRLIALRR